MGAGRWGWVWGAESQGEWDGWREGCPPQVRGAGWVLGGCRSWALGGPKSRVRAGANGCWSRDGAGGRGPGWVRAGVRPGTGWVAVPGGCRVRRRATCSRAGRAGEGCSGGRDPPGGVACAGGGVPRPTPSPGRAETTPPAPPRPAT